MRLLRFLAMAVMVTAAVAACGNDDSKSTASVRTIAGCKIEPGTNCPGVNLSGQNLQGVNLSRANLATANLTSANLSSANLSDANLTSANLTKTNFTGANLTGVMLTGAIHCGTIRNDGTIDNSSCEPATTATTTANATTTTQGSGVPCDSAALVTAAEGYGGTAQYPQVGKNLSASGPARCDQGWASQSVAGSSGAPVLFVYRETGGSWVALSYGQRGELCGGAHENVNIPSNIAAKIDC